MSAFIVSPSQINSILMMWNALQYQPTCLLELADMAKTLHKENVRSVNYRYGEKNKVNLTVDLMQCERVDLMQAIKYLDCLEYQSCEREDYKQSKSWHLINQIKADLCYALIRQTPELERAYDLAKWSL